MKRLLPYFLGMLIGLLIVGLAAFLLHRLVGEIDMVGTADRSDDIGWQDWHPQALIPGYSEFRAQRCYLDWPIRIFSYRCPPDTTPEKAFGILKTRNPVFPRSAEDSTTLLLSGPRKDEWRFLFDEKTKVLTAMFSWYSPPESWIELHKEMHDEYRGR